MESLGTEVAWRAVEMTVAIAVKDEVDSLPPGRR